MQRQRQELSQAVRQLTENSNTLYQQIKPNEFSSHNKKRPSIIGWMETDLDSMAYTDHGCSTPSSTIEHTTNNSYSDFNNSTTPLYIDTSSTSSNILNCSSSTNRNFYGNHKHQESDGIESSGMESDDLLEGSQFSNLSKQEKQESKTVRIVKRESQQRQRDRERTGNVSFSNQNLDQVLEEELLAQQDNYAYNRSKSLPRTFMETHEIYRPEQQINKIKPEQPKQSPIQNKYSEYYNNMVNQYPVSMTESLHQKQQQQQPKTSYLEYTSGLKNKTESIQSLTKSIGDLSPVFQSEAAKQIMIEIGANPTDEQNSKVPGANKQRRAVPKEKRRHYTAPHHLSAKSMLAIQAENDMNRNVS